MDDQIYVVVTDRNFMPHWYLSEDSGGYLLTENIAKAVFFTRPEAGIQAISAAGTVEFKDLRLAKVDIEPLW